MKELYIVFDLRFCGLEFYGFSFGAVFSSI